MTMPTQRTGTATTAAAGPHRRNDNNNLRMNTKADRGSRNSKSFFDQKRQSHRGKLLFSSTRRVCGFSGGLCTGVLLITVLMGLFSFLRTSSGRGSSSSMFRRKQQPPALAFATASSMQLHPDPKALQAVVTAALWSFFAGDALSSPTHWFYGGSRQVQQYYGAAGITGYTQPVYELAGSILNKSNLSGGGRSTTTSAKGGDKDTIIGHVINHGKQDLWSPSRSIHYHATLAAGENTLEVQLARVLMKSLAAHGGTFHANHFRDAYVSFMTTPNSHNDTYASTCHRMFFANWHYKKLPAERCPDNDRHNVDTVDGLVLPTVTALAVAGRMDGTIEQAMAQAAATVAVTRNSALLQQYASEWGALVFASVRAAAAAGSDNHKAPVSETVKRSATQMAQKLGLRQPRVQGQDEITACYLDSAVPAMLDFMVKYQDRPVWDSLLVNANTGGENVHRGSCLGAVLGASVAAPEPRLVEGLYQHEQIQDEIRALVEAVGLAAKDAAIADS